jgi:hypothetical protein
VTVTGRQANPTIFRQVAQAKIEILAVADALLRRLKQRLTQIAVVIVAPFFPAGRSPFSRHQLAPSTPATIRRDVRDEHARAP